MPKYLTLVSIHKPLGIAILVLALTRLALRLRYGAPPLPTDLPVPMKLAAAGVALRAIRPDDRHAADRLGNVVGGRLSCRIVRRVASSARSCRRATACIRCSGTRISILPGVSDVVRADRLIAHAT